MVKFVTAIVSVMVFHSAAYADCFIVSVKQAQLQGIQASDAKLYIRWTPEVAEAGRMALVASALKGPAKMNFVPFKSKEAGHYRLAMGDGGFAGSLTVEVENKTLKSVRPWGKLSVSHEISDSRFGNVVVIRGPAETIYEIVKEDEEVCTNMFYSRASN